MGVDQVEAAKTNPPPKPRHPTTVEEAERMLDEFFPPHLVQWRPQGGKGDKTLAMPYIDARAVQDRLDRVFGKPNWEVTYRETKSGGVRCRLRVRFPGIARRVVKEDVGSPSDMFQASEADNVKGGYSDALKRAAVQLGVGRYLYRMGSVWCDWDGKRLTETPDIPDHFRPPDYRRAGDKLSDEAVQAVANLARVNPKVKTQDYIVAFLAATAYYAQPDKVPLCDVERRHVLRLVERARRDAEDAAAALPDTWPKTGPELAARLARHDAELARAGLCLVGGLLADVLAAGVKAGFPPALSQWDRPSQIKVAVGWAVEWEKARRAEMASARAEADAVRRGTPEPEPAAAG